MSSTTWTEADTEQALSIWADYLSRHDVSSEIGRTAGIDPAASRVWFGESAADIWQQRQAEGAKAPIYCVRVGFDYYVRKGKHIGSDLRRNQRCGNGRVTGSPGPPFREVLARCGAGRL